MTMYALVDARACESTYMCTRAYDTHTHASTCRITMGWQRYR